MFDYVAVSSSLDNRVVGWVDRLREHFVHSAAVHDARYMAPLAAGYSIETLTDSLDRFGFSGGSAWSDPNSIAEPVGVV
jgi:L-fuconate dehydratase